MNILFLMFSFPDMGKSFNMYTAVVEEFVKNGHNVVVLAPGKQPTGISVENHIPVLRVKTLPIKNIPNVFKGLTNILLVYQYSHALRKYYKESKFDLIFMPTPPITLVDLAVRLKKKFNARIYLMLRDIFPQNAVDLRIMSKGSLFYAYFRSKERKLYRNADFIGCMSPANIEFLLKHNPWMKKEKIHELKNFQKKYTGYGHSHRDLLIKYEIEHRFVVVFGGNMGKAQQMENVLELAEKVKIYKDVVFLLLGEGLQAERIAQKAKARGLDNIVLHSTIPKQEFQDLLSCCQIGLISLHADFSVPNIPSKALDYFNVGIPVLASLDKATDFGQILDDEKCGLWTYAGNHDKLFELFETLYTNQKMRQEMGSNGRKYFERELLPEKAYQTILNVIA